MVQGGGGGGGRMMRMAEGLDSVVEAVYTSDDIERF
jgi:hypothetical protein